MNYTSFVQIDDSLAFNPGYITRVRFGYDRMNITRVSITFVDGVSVTLTDNQLASFLEWWNNRAIVVTKIDDDTRNDNLLCFVQGQQVPEAPEM